MARKLNNTATVATQSVDAVRKGLVLRTAQNLLKPTNSVTNLEIKDELRKTQKGFYWDQKFVSDCMDEFAQLGIFKYLDNGTYRTYYDPSRILQAKATPAPKTTPAPKKAKVAKATKKDKWATSTRISKSKALQMMQNNKGHFFSLQFVKKGDGSVRTMNCQYLPGQSVTLGIVKVKEASLVRAKSSNPVRSFDLSTVKKLSIGGQVYNVR